MTHSVDKETLLSFWSSSQSLLPGEIVHPEKAVNILNDLPMQYALGQK